MSTDLEDRLRAGLARVPARVPPGLARAAYRRYRRRRAAARAIAAAGTAAAIIGSVVAADLPRSSAPAAETTAYVAEHVARALDALSPDTVIFDRTVNYPASAALAPRDSWTGPGGRSRMVQFTPSGQIVTDQETTFTRTRIITVFADHRKKTWWRLAVPRPPVTPAPSATASQPCNGASINELTFSAPVMAADIRSELACGQLRKAGTGVVDGVSAVRLTGTLGGITETYWVSTATYLPVRITTVWGHLPGYQQDDFRWLPPTTANLAKLGVQVPAGFRQVPPPKYGEATTG